MLLPCGSVRRKLADLQDVKQQVFAWADDYRHLAGTASSGESPWLLDWSDVKALFRACTCV